MDRKDVKPEMRVEVTFLNETMGMRVDRKYLGARREGVTGTVMSCLPDSKEEVWLVQHENSDEIGAYSFDELEHA